VPWQGLLLVSSNPKACAALRLGIRRMRRKKYSDTEAGLCYDIARENALEQPSGVSSTRSRRLLTAHA
jgi:hypothetical protein